MKVAGFLLLLLTGSSALAAGSKLDTKDCDFGEVYAFNRVECDITLTNSGDTPIRISEFSAARTGDSVEPRRIEIAPHASAYVKAVVNTGNDVGHARHVFRFASDEKGHEQQRAVAARGFVLSVLDDARPIVDMGIVDLANELPSRKVDLGSHDLADFRIQGVLEKPPYVDVQIAPDGQSVTLKLLATAPWGYQGDFVKLRTNATQQKQVDVGVQADIHGKILPSSNPFSMGLNRVGSSNEQLIRLTSRDGKDFKVGTVTLESLGGSASVEPCVPISQGCKIVRLRISDEQPIGSIIGKVMVDLPEFSQHLLVAVNGMMLGKDTKIEKLDAEEMLGKANQKDGASVTSPAVDLGKAIKSAMQGADDVAPAGKGPLLKWSVVNEAQIHGYQIFRASEEGGPFVLLNRSTIPTKSRDNSGSAYQWRDSQAEAGKTYWYYIGIVYNNGRKQQLTGQQKVVAKMD